MAYPIRVTEQIATGQTLAVPFRPTEAGIVNATVNASTVVGGGPGQVRIEIGQAEGPVRAAASTASAPANAVIADIPTGGNTGPGGSGNSPPVEPGVTTLWVDTEAGATDANTNWVLTITNVGDLDVECSAVIRYQVMPGDLGKIDHIVAVMMENRSFDHILGYLTKEGGRTDVDGLIGNETNNDDNGASWTVYPLTETFFATDPGHSWDDVSQQLAGDGQQASNAGFVRNFEYQLSNDTVSPKEPASAIMGYHNASHVPVYDMFAREFAICDQWYASIPTDTWPNRLYFLTGGSGGMINTPSDADVESDPPGYTLKSIFEVLHGAGIDWNVFYSDVPFALVFKTIAQDAEYTSRIRPITEFVSRAKTGDLPPVTWLDPNFNDFPDDPAPGGTSDLAASDDHPPGDVARGQQFIANIYAALTQSPVWSKTLLIITYDEHGGFYDHVLPPGTVQRPDVVTPVGGVHRGPAALPGTVDHPAAPVVEAAATSAAASGVDNTHATLERAVGPMSGTPLLPVRPGPPDDLSTLEVYGVRVPTFLVSPWVESGAVSKAVYDHTSVLRTILRRFCVEQPEVVVAELLPGVDTRPANIPSMGKRTDNANDLESALSSTSPRLVAPIAPAPPPPDSRRPGGGAVFDPNAFGAVLRKSIIRF
jgi:phospholipase C